MYPDFEEYRSEIISYIRDDNIDDIPSFCWEYFEGEILDLIGEYRVPDEEEQKATKAEMMLDRLQDR